MLSIDSFSRACVPRSGTVRVVQVLSLWWRLWRGELPLVDEAAALLVASERAQAPRVWVSIAWGWVAWLLTIEPLVLRMYPLWLAPFVVAAWVCMLFSPPSALRARVAARLAQRVRAGLTDPSPVVRGWSAGVVAFVVCEHPELPLLRWRLTVGSEAFDGTSLLFRRRSERPVLAESRNALFHFVETLRLSSKPELGRDRVRLVVTAARSVWSSPVVEQSLQVAHLGAHMVRRQDALAFLSSAWFVSAALADPSVRSLELFSVGSGVMMVSASSPDAPYGSEPCLRGASRSEVRSRRNAPPEGLLARADLAVALSSSWHVPEPEFSFGVALGRTDDHAGTALLGLVDAVWALVPDARAAVSDAGLDVSLEPLLDRPGSIDEADGSCS